MTTTGSFGEAGSRWSDADAIDLWLVDDSDNFRELLADLLGREPGLNCARQFSTAEAVLEALGHEPPPDVILLDNRMPGMGGLAAIRPIKTLAPSTRVLMLTTFADPQTRAEALGNGAADLILKSFSLEDIVRRIREVHRLPAGPAEIATARSGSRLFSERPGHRVPETNGQERIADELFPEPGRRKTPGQSAIHRLARGVNRLRSRVSQALEKATEGRRSRVPLRAEAPKS